METGVLNIPTHVRMGVILIRKQVTETSAYQKKFKLLRLETGVLNIPTPVRKTPMSSQTPSPDFVTVVQMTVV